MITSILGKWAAINAPHRIEFFDDGTCATFSPADGGTIRGKYSVSDDKIKVFMGGDSAINFEIVSSSSIQMLPPSGRALPPLPFKRA